MIRPININLNAAHPELPLVEATTFTGAPSTVFIRGVPKSVGNWSITAVSVAVTYPDNTTTARAAVESAEGVWVATIPGTATSGRTAAGFKIMADGIDENGAAVTGYVLGFADFSVLSFTPVPAPGGTFYLLRYFDQAPATPKEGDVAVVDGLLKMYNGTAWVGFGDGPGFSTDNPQMDGSASPGSAATAARSDHVHPTDTTRAADNAVVKLAGEQQTMSAVLQLMSTLYAESGVESHGDYRLMWTVGGDYAGALTISQDTISVQLADENEPRQYKLQAGGGGTLALLENIAPEFVYFQSYGVGDLCTSFDNDPSHMGTWLYKCIAATDGSTPPEIDTTHWTLATVEDVLAALRTALAGKADASDLLTKLDSTSAAPAFSSDSSTQYAVGSHCTYNGKLYKCATATTGGTWVAGSWTADTMTDPDAVLDITSQNQLRVVAKDGTLLWAQGYDLASTSSATLACDATNNFTFADGATSQAFTLPTAPTGKVGDFGLDIDNSANTGAATMTLTGLDTTFSVVVPEGESLNDMLAIAAGELARFYITLSTFRVNNLPTWHVVKQVVENGGAQS